MPHSTFILIPGRTSRQGTSLNEGKDSEQYLAETGTVLMNPGDMQRLGIKSGERVRLTSSHGSTQMTCKASPKDELPAGVLFVAYGPPVCVLIGGDTHGTGMPDSKAIDVRLERVEPG
jgi:formylmethanofuran dehydrogenase subunit D